MKLLKSLVLAAFMAAFFMPAQAQWQTPLNSVPIGTGSGVGFNSVGPGTNNQGLFGNTGAAPSFRALTGADLPNPGASSLGGVQSVTCAANSWINSISTLGVPGCTAGATVGGNNTWTGDNLFASGRPWCDVRSKGAVGDGTTDDSAAFNACVTQCITTKSYGACTVLVPPSSSAYCIKNTININTGLTTNGGIILKGSGVQGTVLSACGTNTNLINLNDQWAQVRDMTVQGYGVGNDPVFSGTAPSQPTILMQSFCSNCVIENVYATGGTAAIQNSGACGYTLSNVWGSFSYGDGTHVFGFFTQINCGGTVWNSHFDMVYPVSQPAHGTSIAARGNTTPYTTGTIVSVTCNARTWYIQASNNGTSAGAFPGCKPFGTAIADGTVNWQLVNAATSYCIQLDTGSIETEILHTDATCAAQYNIAQTNTYAGTAPTQNRISLSTPGAGFSGNIYLNSGNHTTLVGMETSFCLLAGCAGVLIDSATVSSVKVTNLDCINGFAYCVNITAAASHILVSQMQAAGADTADFNVSAAATGFQLVNSEHTSGAGNLFTIAAVAADHYIIGSNICNGASSSDGGTGTHKAVTACSGAGP